MIAQRIVFSDSATEKEVSIATYDHKISASAHQ